MSSGAEQGQGQAAPSQPNAQQPSQQQPPQPLIKPEQITAQNFPFFSPETLSRYQTGFKSLWTAINANPPGSEPHQQALRKLHEANAKLVQQLRTQKNAQLAKQQNLQQQQAQQPQQAQQLQQQAQRKPQQGNVAADEQNAQRLATQDQSQMAKAQLAQPAPSSALNPIKVPDELPADIKAKVEKADLMAPASLRPEGTGKWYAEAAKRYGEALYIIRTAKAAINNLDRLIQTAQARNEEVPPELISKRADCHRQLNESDGFIHRLAGLQQQAGIQRTVYDELASSSQNANTNGQARPGSNLPVNSVTQQQQPQQTRPTSASGPQGQAAASNLTQMGSNNQAQVFNGQRQVQNPLPGAPLSQNQSRPPSQPVTMGGSNNEPPIALSHQQAVAAVSKTWHQVQHQQMQQAQQNLQMQQGPPHMQNPPQPPATLLNMPSLANHSDLDKIERKPDKMMPINRSFIPTTPQPVSMPPSRPTLSGANNGPLGMMGQPAILKPEPYLLQGPGDRVLDKKKLDELVRQVTGGGGADGEALHPEVEEAMLNLADEFIENVVSSACKLAKLRGSTSLEVRDIQLILERQYNIRIPGYATDEVRTVRKIQPAAGYLQKMNAVQAAKVMNGRADI